MLPGIEGNIDLAQRIERDVTASINSLCRVINLEHINHETHSLLLISGITRTDECLQCLAVYCVGQIANAIQANLSIRADLLGDGEDTIDRLSNDVFSVIGENNNALTLEQKRDERNPLLFEFISHLLVHISVHRPEFHPTGRLIGLFPVHVTVNIPGLDLIALYANEENVGLGVGECKAREDSPSPALIEASKKFIDIDLGNRDSEIRTNVSLIRFGLPDEYQSRITGAFWREERTYYPFIGYSNRHNPRWGNRRAALMRLNVPPERRILIPLAIEFQDFFDDLSNQMRIYLESLET